MVDLYKELDSINVKLSEYLKLFGIDNIDIVNLQIYYRRFKCSYKNCRCRNGGLGHGPYPRLYYDYNGKRMVKYISKKLDAKLKKRFGENSLTQDIIMEIKKMLEKRRNLMKFIKKYEDFLEQYGYN